MSLQNNRKPEPLLNQPSVGRVCPVCGKKSYSLTGIHPQCAVQQADAPRQRQLAVAKRHERDLAERAKAAAGPTLKKISKLHSAASS
jgi:hypothetical protein